MSFSKLILLLISILLGIDVTYVVLFHENQTSGGDTLMAPIYLPLRAIIRPINVMYKDNAVGDVPDIALIRKGHLHPESDARVNPVGVTTEDSGLRVLTWNEHYHGVYDPGS